MLLALDSRLVAESNQNNKKKMTTFSSDRFCTFFSQDHHNNNLGSLIQNGNWGKLTFAVTSGSVTKGKGKFKGARCPEPAKYRVPSI